MAFRLLLPAATLMLAACVADSGESYHRPTPVATNGPAACYADAAFTPREERVAIRHTATMMRMGELAACELAKQELASRSPGTCQTHFGSRTDIRNLTARTQFNGGTWICHCRDAGLFMQCDVSGDAVCAFEEATSRCVQGQG
jgi:hypothetical protein